MERQGISFTLTLVVAGVILLMTALSVVTLGGGSLEGFFKKTNEQQQEAVQDIEVQRACQDLAQEISDNYCDQYIKVEYSPSSGVVSNFGPISACKDSAGSGGYYLCHQNFQSGSSVTYARSAWEDNSQADCSAGQDTRVSKTRAAANASAAAYPVTRSQRGGCSIDGYFGVGEAPTVTVEGNTYNCKEQGYIPSECPVQ